MDHQNVVPKTHTFYKKSVWLLLFTIYTVSVFVPWVPRSWQPPCNNSWALILHNAFIKGEAFGSEVVFTFGPFGFLYFGAIPQTHLLTLLGWLLIAAGFVIAVWKALQASLFPGWGKMLCALAVTAVTASVDVPDAQIFAFVAFASVAWLIIRPTEIAANTIVGVALALASLVKFSWFVAIVPPVVAITLFEAIRERRCAIISVVYGFSCVLLWLASGQSLGSVGPYLGLSLEVAGGYAAAMQLGHAWGMTNVWWFLLIAFVLLALYFFPLRKRDPWSSLGCSGVLAFLLFITFKAGFVRHDHHEVVAFAVLVAVGVLVVSMSRGLILTSLTSLALAASLILYGSSVRLHLRNPSFEPRFGQVFRLGGVSDFARFLSGGVSPAASYDFSMKQVVGAQDLELPIGTVDLYPWGGIDKMYANNLKVRHRPVFESYTAFTPRLARINADFLAGETAPDHLLFAVRAIDQRFPAMEDGLSWPEIITRYDISGEQQGYLLMERRDSPATYKLSQLSETQIQPEIAIALPGGDALWVQIDLPLTMRGKLMQQLYKPAIISLVLRFSDGGTHAFRLIPKVASAGFLISPVIPNNAAFAVFRNKPSDLRLSPLRPVAIAISGETG
jgi:hypothetical protein